MLRGPGSLLFGFPPLQTQMGGEQPFSPDEYDGLGLWIDAAHAASLFQDSEGTIPVAANNDPVGRVGRVASNYAWMDTTANKPALILNALNGLPVIRFGSDDWLWLSNLALLNNVPSLSYFSVLKYPDDTAINTELFYSVGISTVLSRFSSNLADADHKLGISGRRLDNDAIGLMRATDPDFNFMLKDAVVSYATATATVCKNGAVIATGPFQTAGNTSATDSLRATVGAATDPIGQFFRGDLAEILMYVPALTPDQRLTVLQYLSTKWGITLS